MNTTRSRPRPGLAVLLALLCNGLGHLYAGRALAGLVIQVVWLGAGVAMMLSLRFGIGFAVAASAAALAFWIWQAAFAARAAHAASETVPRGWLSRPLSLVSFYLATFLAAATVGGVVQPRTVQTFAQASRSMMPTLKPGDWLVVLPGAPIERGAVVVHAAPPSAPSKDPLLKRVVALGGDTVAVREGRLVVNGVPAGRDRVPGPCSYESKGRGGEWREEPCEDFVETLDGRAYHTYCTPALPCGDVPPQEVPPGQVFVLGDFRDHSADSRVYGPLPERAILGRVSYVYFSIGRSGVRWDRIGRSPR